MYQQKTVYFLSPQITAKNASEYFLMSDIRILAGICKGTKLLTLTGNHTRPTTGRITENIFNILTHNIYIDNFSFKKQKVLDIFAGSGRLGLEALSRGAESATFIDNHLEAGKVIQANIKRCHMLERTEFLNSNALNLNILSVYAPFSLIFCDAPYGQDLSSDVIKQLINKKWLAHNALLCIETEKSYVFNDISYITVLDKRDYGMSCFYFLKYDLLL